MCLCVGDREYKPPVLLAMSIVHKHSVNAGARDFQYIYIYIHVHICVCAYVFLSLDVL
jgi:hypothetical protein